MDQAKKYDNYPPELRKELSKPRRKYLCKSTLMVLGAITDIGQADYDAILIRIFEKEGEIFRRHQVSQICERLQQYGKLRKVKRGIWEKKNPDP